MSDAIDYYFAGASPFTYLGHKALLDVAEKHQIGIKFKPVNIFGLWEISGAVPPGQRPAVRQRYRLIELQRSAEMRGLPINLHPAYFPVDTTLAECCVISILEQGGNPAEYMSSLFRGVWVDECNMAEEQEITSRLIACNFDAKSIVEAAKTARVADIRAANTSEAVDSDAVGVPAYVLNGEVFWGQDRVEFIERALSTGRKAFSAT